MALRTADGPATGRMPDGGFYFDQCHPPLLESNDDARWTNSCANSFGQCSLFLPGRSRPIWGLTAGAYRLRASTDRAILGLFGGSLLEFKPVALPHGPVHGNAGGCMLSSTDCLRCASMPLSASSKQSAATLMWFAFSDDLGAQKGPLLSPKMYREFFKPRHRQLWCRAKELADVKMMLHCCGAVRSVLPDLIEAGI